MSGMRPILVAAGGTGGHIFPALAVADELRKRDVPVIWVGTRAGLEARLVPAANIDIRWMNVVGLRGKGLLVRVWGPFKLIQACWQCLRIFSKVRPGAVLGMGGFVSGPAALVAVLTRKPLVLHEQNAIAGMTNRWLSRFATRVFSAMPEVFPDSVNAQTIGNPVRKGITDLAVKAPSDSLSSCLHVLVIGGSRGARILNSTVPAAVKKLHSPIALHHQTGEAELALVRAAYAGLGNHHEITIDALLMTWRRRMPGPMWLSVVPVQ